MNNKVGFTAGQLKNFETISAKIKEKLDLQTKEDREAYENVHSKLLDIFNRCRPVLSVLNWWRSSVR